MKLVINACYGGFGISEAGARWMAERGHEAAKKAVERFDLQSQWVKEFVERGVWPTEVPEPQRGWLEIDAKYRKAKRWGNVYDVQREDPLLVQMVEALGNESWGEFAKLRIVEIPDGVEWEIDEYDGMESIHEKHRSWS